MKQIFKTEIKRAMSGKGMVLSMLIGTVLGIAHVIPGNNPRLSS